MPTIQVSAEGRRRLARLAMRLREAAAGGLANDLSQGLLQESPDALRAVRAAWMTVDVASSAGGGTKSTGLRARTAAATDFAPTGPLSVRFECDAGQVDGAYGTTLTWGLDGISRWRHPLFGNRDHWFQQVGEEVFFTTLYAHEPQWLRALEAACERTAQRIEG